VPAYSTLGRFADPVLNTMLSYGNNELAAIIFHELSHQLVYVAGDSAFNEAFAVTVEEEGLRRWLALRGREEEIKEHQRRSAQQLAFIALFRSTRNELAKLYASKLEPAAKRERKREIFTQLGREIEALEKTLGTRTIYSRWAREGLNNAHLASVATYFDCVPGFQRLLREEDGDLTRFYSAVRKIAGQPRKERHAKLCAPKTPAVSESELTGSE
jgi:predicted aminopeptidase